MPRNANAGALAGFIAHTGIETPSEPLFKNSLFGFRFLCPGCKKPLRHPFVSERVFCECQSCRRGYMLEMYPPQREPLQPDNSHTFTHLFYVAVSRHAYRDYEKRLGKLEKGDATHNGPQMERAFLRKLGALEMFEAGPPPVAPRSQEQRDRDDEASRRQHRILARMNSDITETLHPGVIMKKARQAPSAPQSPEPQSPEHLRNRKQ